MLRLGCFYFYIFTRTIKLFLTCRLQSTYRGGGWCGQGTRTPIHVNGHVYRRYWKWAVGLFVVFELSFVQVCFLDNPILPQRKMDSTDRGKLRFFIYICRKYWCERITPDGRTQDRAMAKSGSTYLVHWPHFLTFDRYFASY